MINIEKPSKTIKLSSFSLFNISIIIQKNKRVHFINQLQIKKR